MRAPEIGHQETLEVLVTPDMTVRFAELGELHPVYATYELARHFEEVGRKLLLPFLEEGEDGVGTALGVEHLRSALPGMRVRLTATVQRVEGRRLSVTVEAVSELGRKQISATRGSFAAYCASCVAMTSRSRCSRKSGEAAPVDSTCGGELSADQQSCRGGGDGPYTHEAARQLGVPFGDGTVRGAD